MNALQTTTAYNTITPAGDLRPALFEEFITFIDRGEKTTKTYITNLRQFAAFLSYRMIRRPQREDIIAYRDYLGAEHDAIQLDAGSVNGWSYRTDARGNRYTITCKPNTVAQYLRSVCQFFRWTAANNLYPDIAANIHAPKVKHDTHRKEALAAAEVLTIEQSITAGAEAKAAAAAEAEKDTAGRMQRADEQGKRLFAMYLLTTNAGLRTIEISRANVKDLVTKNGQTWLYIWGKGHNEPDQKMPIAPEVAAAIKEYMQSRTDRPTGTSPLFVSTGNRSKGKRIDPTTISKMLKKAMQQAGFDDERITAHSLRHSAAQAALQASGNNIYSAQKYLRHSSPATTEIYLHEDERTEQTARALAQDVYNLYHGNTGTDPRQQLEQLIARMNPAQLAQLTNIAAAMA